MPSRHLLLRFIHSLTPPMQIQIQIQTSPSTQHRGGRAITKEEMKRMDEEEEQRENERRKGREEVLTATQKVSD